MSNEHASEFFFLLRKTEGGDYQFSLSDDVESVKNRMVNEGWRAFSVCHEKTLEDLSK